MRLFITIVLLCSALTGCGVPGAPMPPSLDIPKFVVDLKAVRKGDTVTLTWTTPTETTDAGLIRKPGKMLVQRALSSGRGSDLKFQTISELPLEPPLKPLKKERGEQATAQDTLTDALRSSGAEFAVYSILAQGHSGKSFGLPNRASVPLLPTLAPPQKVVATPVAAGVAIRLQGFGTVPTDSRLHTQYAYKLMRRQQDANESSTVTQLNAGDQAIEFTDTTIEWEKNYQYWVTPVTLWQDEKRKGEIEGEDSAIINVFAHDSFPPAAPASLQAVYTAAPPNSFIDLTWSPNTESDLAGYNVYRQSANTPPSKLNSELIKTPRFPDPQIQPGTKYFYSVTAVDLRGNESSKSEETSESVPKD
jgi:hypothetical protein